MANYGNTGQRYKLRQVTGVTIEEGTYVRTTLECGHSTRANWEKPESVQWALERGQRDIDKRQRTRCTQCKA